MKMKLACSARVYVCVCISVSMCVQSAKNKIHEKYINNIAHGTTDLVERGALGSSYFFFGGGGAHTRQPHAPALSFTSHPLSRVNTVNTFSHTQT